MLPASGKYFMKKIEALDIITFFFYTGPPHPRMLFFSTVMLYATHAILMTFEVDFPNYTTVTLHGAKDTCGPSF